jgi:transcription elongation factor GreA
VISITSVRAHFSPYSRGFVRQLNSLELKNRGELARETLITPEGLEKLKDELGYLENDKRREVADRIKQAREFGDIAENSEYDDAKNEQAMLEQRIASLQDRLRRAAVIDKKHIDTETVGVGAVVHVKDQKSGKSQKFQIVGSAEANPVEQKLSNESPIGKALVGSKKNEVVTVETPRGPKRKLKVTKIEAA